MDNPYLEVISYVERLHRQFLEVVKLELEGFGIHDINNVQAMMLFNIGDAEMTVGELTLRGCYLGSNVSYNVKKMVENEYLAHERSVHDRRSIHVRLTKKGIKLRDSLIAMHRRHAEMLSRATVSADDLQAAGALALGLGGAAVASEVTTPVEQLHAGLMAIMKAGKMAPFRQRYDMIAPVIGQTFDLEVILRQVIGPRLAALPPDQRAAVGDAFRRYTIASYVANFDTYSGQRFEVAPVVRAAGSDRIVETQIAAASGQGYVLDYVMRQESGGWKVVDVLVDGAISRVAAQRSEMRSMLADSGGAGLLVGLRQKTADLSGGILQ